MDCNEIRQAPVLVEYLRSKKDTDVDRTFLCLKKLFYNAYLSTALRKCYKNSYARHNANELADDAFNRGLFRFYEVMRTVGFKAGIGSVDAVFISFCLWQLKKVIKTAMRDAIKIRGGDPAAALVNIPDEDNDPVFEAELEVVNKREQLFLRGFGMLGERCQELIICRKFCA